MTVGSLTRPVGTDEVVRSGVPPPAARSAGDGRFVDLLVRDGCAQHVGDVCRSRYADFCPTCGFQAPTRLEAMARLHNVTDVWRSLLGDGASDVRCAAAFARDEFHAVANRVQRLIDEPGTRVASLRIGAPSIMWSIDRTRLLIALLDDASQRLARLAAGLRADQWDVSGRIDANTISVAGLIAVPLHTAHREVTRHGSGVDVLSATRCHAAARLPQRVGWSAPFAIGYGP